jgi:hypothetical protein
MNNYTLIVTNPQGYKVNIASHDLDSLKSLAFDYNRQGLNVQITETFVVFQVIQNEKQD